MAPVSKLVARYLLAAYILLAIGLGGVAYRIEVLQRQAVQNGRLTIALIHQQCKDANNSAKAFNSQNPPPAYQRPYRNCR